jgi:hypothetical protein
MLPLDLRKIQSLLMSVLTYGMFFEANGMDRGSSGLGEFACGVLRTQIVIRKI